MPESFDETLLTAIERYKRGEETLDDRKIIGQALASRQLEIIPSRDSKVIRQSGGANFGEENEIRVSGSVIGTQTISGISGDQVLEILKLNEKKEDNNTKIILAIFGVIAIIAVGVLGYLVVAKDQNPKEATQTETNTNNPIQILPTEVPIKLAVEDYQNDSLKYFLTIQNNSEKQQLLSTIGIVSNVIVDPPVCLPETAGQPLYIAMDYFVEFFVSDEETAYKMEPPLTIPPNDFVRFSVALVPYDCGRWSSEVTLFVENADGIRVQTEPQTINSSDS
jgi:hypothetical protein